MEGIVYWITGLSGAGKTVIGKELFKKIKKTKENVVILDGDDLRKIFGNDLGYTKEDRLKCAMRYANICKLLSSQGIDVICCTISMFHEVRLWNRENMERYKEIYVEVPMETLKARNQKGLYTVTGKKENVNVAGVDLTIDLPTDPHMIIHNIGGQSPEKLAENILMAVK